MIKAFSNENKKNYSEKEYVKVCKDYPKSIVLERKNGYTVEQRFNDDESKSILLIVDTEELRSKFNEEAVTSQSDFDKSIWH